MLLKILKPRYVSIERLQEQLLSRLNGDMSDLVIFEKGTDSTIFVEYTDYIMRNHKKLQAVELEDAIKKLELNPDFETRKLLITALGYISDVKAYRALEKIVNNDIDDLNGWAVFAFQQSRALIEDSLSDKSRFYIFSGLGGKANLLRYFAVAYTEDKALLTDFQKERFRKELEYEAAEKEAEIEEVVFYDYFVTFKFLLSIRHIAFDFIDNVIDNVNELGGKFSEETIVATDKIYSEDEIRRAIDGELLEGEVDMDDNNDMFSYLD